MAETHWQLSGDYFETCNCDFLCPCAPSNLTARPDKGECKAALVYHVNRGRHGEVSLDDLTVVVAFHAPGVLAQGNWTVGLVIDERANAEQQSALTEIFSGQAGGPMADLAPLVGTFAGVATKPIHFEKSGRTCAISIPDMLDQASESLVSEANPGEPIYVVNSLNPAASERFTVAKAVRSVLHAFGIDWEDTSGLNSSYMARFEWQAP